MVSELTNGDRPPQRGPDPTSDAADPTSDPADLARPLGTNVRRRQIGLLEAVRRLVEFHGDPDSAAYLKDLRRLKAVSAGYKDPHPFLGRTRALRLDPYLEGTIGLRIRTARVRAGIFQSQPAGAIGMSQPVLSRIERGVRSARHSEVAKIEAALGVTIEV
jgi:hypothetical protein